MSKAREWAKRRMDAYLNLLNVNDGRPEISPQAWSKGTGWTNFEVSDLGLPVLNLKGLKSEFDDEHLPGLLAQCRWVLDTFGEEAS